MKERFEDLVDDGVELDDAERERLRRVHELLVEVGPPAEVPPELREPPRAEPVRLLPRRRRAPLALVAAVTALALFGAGWLFGERSATPPAAYAVEMSGEGAARGVIEVLEQDAAGNWPMRVRVHGLEPSEGREDFYELWVTRDGELVASCGRFTLHEDVTEVTLSVPYALKSFDGWVVTRAGSDEPLLST